MPWTDINLMAMLRLNQQHSIRHCDPSNKLGVNETEMQDIRFKILH